MNDLSKILENSLLQIWNNRNAEQRLTIMKKIYSPEIDFFEDNTGAAITGYDAINQLIEKLQTNWPAEFEFSLHKAQVNHNVNYVTWSLGVPGQPPVASGMDIAIIENDKIKSLYLYLDSNN